MRVSILVPSMESWGRKRGRPFCGIAPRGDSLICRRDCPASTEYSNRYQFPLTPPSSSNGDSYVPRFNRSSCARGPTDDANHSNCSDDSNKDRIVEGSPDRSEGKYTCGDRCSVGEQVKRMAEN